MSGQGEEISTLFKVFLSYSSKDRVIARKIKRGLNTFGVATFLAHDDLTPTVEWEEEILCALRECDAFLPILTENYPTSSWTDQEVGVAVGLKKVVLPISVGINPYGFIARYQAIRLRDSDVTHDFCGLAVDALMKNTRLGAQIRQGIINSFVESNSFTDAAEKAANLLRIKHLDPDELQIILEAASTNNQIYQSFRAQNSIATIISRYKSKIDPRLARRFRVAAGFI